MAIKKAPPILQPQVEACCPPIGAKRLPVRDAEHLSLRFAAVADPVRLRILSLLATVPDGAICACDLVDPIGRSQPTVSQSFAGPETGRAGHGAARRQEHLVRGRARRPRCPA